MVVIDGSHTTFVWGRNMEHMKYIYEAISNSAINE